MSDEDVSAEDTRYIWAEYRLAGELLFAGIREAYRFAIFRGPCMYRLLENRCASVADTINVIKYLIWRRNAEDQIFRDHQLESRLSKINRFSFCFSLR